MKLVTPSVILWALASAMSLAGIVQITHVTQARLPAAGGDPRSALDESTHREPGGELDVRATARAALFRSSRRPASSRYGSAHAQERIVRSEAERPAWILTGIVAARNPLAVFESSGSKTRRHVVSIGELADGYKIEAIGGDSAVVSMALTSWVFRLVSPWKR